MKITILETSSNKPLANAQIKLHVQGDKNALNLKTDQVGHVDINDNLRGKQIASSMGNGQGPWTTATDGATLKVAQAGHSGGQSGSQGGKAGMQHGSNKNKETYK